MRTLLTDVGYTLRAIRRFPGFHALVLGILALGIGASVAVFSLVDGVVLHPLPYHDSERLISVDAIAVKPPFETNGSFPYADFEQFRTQSRTLQDVSVMYRSGWSQQTITADDRSQERVRGGFVSSDFFRLFQRSPMMGRLFTAEENTRGEHVLVVSERLAVRRFGSAAQALGKDLQMARTNWRIIGVMANDFRVPFLDSQFWAPIVSHPGWIDKEEPHSREQSVRWDIMARLRPGIPLSTAQAEVDALYGRMAEASPDFHKLRAMAVPLREHFTGVARRQFGVLFASVVFLFLIACANVANLMLARATARQREFAIRAALGAGVRLLRQVVTEAVTLCVLAGALGVTVSLVLVRVLARFAPAGTPRLDEVRIDSRTLLFACALSLSLGLCLGIASVWRQWHQPNELLLASGRGTTASRESRRLKNLLVVSEFALAMVLLTGAALLVRSFVAVLGVDLGFRPQNLLVVWTIIPPDMVGPQRVEFYRSAMERIRSLPGVRAVGASDYLFSGTSRTHALRAVEGRPPEPVEKWGMLEWAEVSGDYFQALGVPLLRGRYFDQRDGPDAPPVVMVNETLARRYWPGEDPVGKRIKGMDPRGPGGGKNDDWLTVIGVVKDIRGAGAERAPIAQIYEVQAQRGELTSMFLVRTSGDPVALAAAARSAIRDASPSAQVTLVKTGEGLLDEERTERRFETWLIGLFSAIALALAALGVFAVMHFAVIAKTREIGIRVAVGARAADIVGLVIRDGSKLAVLGIGVGAFASMWASQALAGILFEVKPTDAASFGGAAAVLACVAIAACYLPARRAARLDAVTALREE